MTPLAPGRVELRLSMSVEDEGNLRYAQALLGHAIPSADAGTVVSRALAVLVRHLERRKFAATSRPGRRRATASPRHIPAHVRRAVWLRDQGRCTFTGADGKRCEACSRLEFDHIEPVARGGTATVENLRLRCRAHNQYAAEQVFGSGFMAAKRERARGVAAEAQLAPGQVGDDRDVTPWLRRLGFRADEARKAAAHPDVIQHTALEQRVRAALTFLAPSHKRVPCRA